METWFASKGSCLPLRPRAVAKGNSVVRRTDRGEEIFRHNLVLLGMGEDGHTASLFSGSAALKEKERWVVENYVAGLDSWRITFAYPLIAAAREVAFLVRGERKRPVIEKILAGEGKIIRLPRCRRNK